ncbi:hypothetical protein C8A01DRAFT_44589 [Parachaetomium inaequale]|uniref:Mitochondrial import inner membrane translocase subunit TIM44 n=1 Tax=Parachaetomium inaequale TaxID=2588326 RepID=A0AAN6PPY2_9PEZI|nr:hypothetical protein C8A01DRAFT_44589 [Parachaetomium inaequale]
MNSARHIHRLAPGAPLRASGLRSSRCTPPSQYRSLSSRTAQLSIPESATYSASTLLRRQPLLRSALPASAIRLDSVSPSTARSFHISARTQQKEPAEKDAKTRPETKEGEQTKESESKEESKEEAKEEKEGDEKAEGKEKEKKEDLPPPPPHGDKTPWQVFLDTMNTELKESKEWNESTKALASSANDFVESERVRKARQAYEATSGAVSSTAAKAVKSTAGAIGKGATWTWETPVMKGVRKGANKTGEVLDKATKPIRETEAYKNVKDVIDDGSSSRYGGWVDKEERKRRRDLREQMDKKNGVVNAIYDEDPNAGTNVTLHKDAAWKEAWRDFRDQNKFVQGIFGMKSVYQESENPLISTARSITDKVAGFFAENETAMVIKKLRTMDPAFKLEPFLQELREYILPEVLDAYVKGDVETLKLWLSEAQYSVYEALTKQYLQAGLKSDGKILDIRGVDILRARMLDPGEIPVFIVTCRTQEVHVYRNAKSNELAAGMEDKVQLVTYAIGITRIAEDVNNPETRGWRLIEMQKSGRDYI